LIYATEDYKLPLKIVLEISHFCFYAPTTLVEHIELPLSGCPYG